MSGSIRKRSVPSDFERAQWILEAIEELVDDEGASLDIICVNGCFINGLPNRAVELSHDKTGWEAMRFTGDTLAGALENALSFLRGGKGGS